ncbi:MAG: cytochrome b5 domain-containing protein [Pelovirga sp.]
MTLAELSTYDGRDGKPAYVAVSGVVYDVSNSKLWTDGNHEGAHQAGQDLTEELKTAPHVRSVIERFPVIGQLNPSTTGEHSTSKLPLVPLLAVAAVAIILLIILLR